MDPIDLNRQWVGLDERGVPVYVAPDGTYVARDGHANPQRVIDHARMREWDRETKTWTTWEQIQRGDIDPVDGSYPRDLTEEEEAVRSRQRDIEALIKASKAAQGVAPPPIPNLTSIDIAYHGDAVDSMRKAMQAIKSVEYTPGSYTLSREQYKALERMMGVNPA